MFIDEVEIQVIAGKGGDGLVSWRREKYIPKGGPRGGNGGNGGDIFFQTTRNLNTLSDFRHKKVLSAKKGGSGGTQDMTGAGGEDLILKVPVGTIIKDLDSLEIIADLSHDNMLYKIVSGGRGGYGNSHFVSSTRQAPAFAELGDVGEERKLKLELKLVADIGIIGIPSAGKSTLINSITNVKAKTGDYPFTTLTPNLGVLDHKGKSLVLEDVPGLIPGASEGKGLGIEFLKHIERTGVLVHLLDSYRLDNIFSDYESIRKELESFSDSLSKKEEIVVLSKSDLLDNEMKDFLLSEFKKKYNKKESEIFVVSSATGEGIDEFKDFLIDNYVSDEESFYQDNLDQENAKQKVYDLKSYADEDPKDVKLEYLGDLAFRASGIRLEQIVRMTNFDNFEAIMRVYDVLEKLGVTRKIEARLEQVFKEENIDDSFYFEGSESEDISPKLYIGDREINLNKLKYSV